MYGVSLQGQYADEASILPGLEVGIWVSVYLRTTAEHVYDREVAHRRLATIHSWLLAQLCVIRIQRHTLPREPLPGSV